MAHVLMIMAPKQNLFRANRKLTVKFPWRLLMEGKTKILLLQGLNLGTGLQVLHILFPSPASPVLLMREILALFPMPSLLVIAAMQQTVKEANVTVWLP